MTLLEDQLVVKESTLPGSGKGLFTKIFIPKGTRIIEYRGKITTWKDVDHQDGSNGYIFFVRRNHVIDGKPFKKEKARFINDARGITRVKGITNNSQYIKDGLRIFVEATKNIPAGNEIFVDYGKEYWDTVKKNAKS